MGSSWSSSGHWVPSRAKQRLQHLHVRWHILLVRGVQEAVEITAKGTLNIHFWRNVNYVQSTTNEIRMKCKFPFGLSEALSDNLPEEIPHRYTLCMICHCSVLSLVAGYERPEGPQLTWSRPRPPSIYNPLSPCLHSSSSVATLCPANKYWEHSNFKSKNICVPWKKLYKVNSHSVLFLF